MKLYILTIMLALATVAQAQSDRQLIRSGNSHYRQKQYAKAETDYRKALTKNSQNAQAAYNLGRVLQVQGKQKEALAQYDAAAKMEKDRTRRAMSYHNMGTIHQKQQELDKAVKDYKQALLLNPKDNETRYNLAQCLRQQRQQQQQQQQQNKNQQQQNKNNKQDKDKQNQKQQPKDNKMSRDNAEQMLQAAMQEEQATQKRLQNAMRQPAQRRKAKNW